MHSKAAAAPQQAKHRYIPQHACQQRRDEPTLNACELEVSLAQQAGCWVQALQSWQRRGELPCPELSWKPQRLPMLQILAHQPDQQAV